MLELLVGLVILSLAMLPLLVFTHSSSRGTYSIGKHLKAGTLAAGIMDRLLALPFDECLADAQALESEGTIEVLNDPLLQQVLEKCENLDSEDLEKSFRFFRCQVNVKPGIKTEADRMFAVSVRVSWRVDDGFESSRQSIDLRAIKFRGHI